ncbi:MAG: oxygenase MpaB family protein [Nakamurella sp.]
MSRTASRYAVRDRNRLLDPAADAHQIYRDMALIDFPSDMKLGLHLAFYRSFIIPGIAELLARTGEIQAHTDKRTMDTGLLMYELIYGGTESERGRQVIAMLNRMHHRYDIPADQYQYILATFVVQPTRWIEQAGWRPIEPVEREASAQFYGRVGKLMAIRDIPDTFADFDSFLVDYERQHAGRSDAALQLMAASQMTFANRLPTRLQGLSDPLVAAMTDEPTVLEALGLSRAPRWLRAAVHGGLGARKIITRHRPPLTESAFTPGHHGRDQYPGGYQLEELGVQPS